MNSSHKRLCNFNPSVVNIHTQSTGFKAGNTEHSGIIAERGNSVIIVTDFKLDDQGLIPDRGTEFSSSLCVQSSSEAHRASRSISTGVLSPG